MPTLDNLQRSSATDGDAPGYSGVFASPGMRQTLLDGALAWLVAEQHRFDPPMESAILDETPEEIGQGRKRKAFGELGAALRLAHRVPALRRHPHIGQLTGAWLDLARSRQIFFDARRRVQLFPQMAVALGVFETLDPGRQPQAQAELQRVLDRGFMDRVERSAWHKLDLKYYFDAAGLTHRFEADDVLLAQSSLMAPPSLPWATAMDLYGVTHLIFHFTDFGERPLPRPAGFDLSALEDYVALALSMSLVERDFDLVAELLMSRICLGVRGDDLNRAAAAALCAAQQPAGFLPDRRWQAGLPEREPEEAATELFFAVYHPTLVTLFLIACDMIPPAPWVEDR